MTLIDNKKIPTRFAVMGQISVISNALVAGGLAFFSVNTALAVAGVELNNILRILINISIPPNVSLGTYLLYDTAPIDAVLENTQGEKPLNAWFWASHEAGMLSLIIGSGLLGYAVLNVYVMAIACAFLLLYWAGFYWCSAQSANKPVWWYKLEKSSSFWVRLLLGHMPAFLKGLLPGLATTLLIDNNIPEVKVNHAWRQVAYTFIALGVACQVMPHQQRKLVREAHQLFRSEDYQLPETVLGKLWLVPKGLLFLIHVMAQCLQSIGVGSHFSRYFFAWSSWRSGWALVAQSFYLFSSAMTAMSIGCYYGIAFLGIRRLPGREKQSAYEVANEQCFVGKIMHVLAGVGATILLLPLLSDIIPYLKNGQSTPQPIASMQGGKAIACTLFILLSKALLCFSAKENLKLILDDRTCDMLLVLSAVSLVLVQGKRLFNGALEIFCHTKEGGSPTESYNNLDRSVQKGMHQDDGCWPGLRNCGLWRSLQGYLPCLTERNHEHCATV